MMTAVWRSWGPWTLSTPSPTFADERNDQRLASGLRLGAGFDPPPLPLHGMPPCPSSHPRSEPPAVKRAVPAGSNSPTNPLPRAAHVKTSVTRRPAACQSTCRKPCCRSASLDAALRLRATPVMGVQRVLMKDRARRPRKMRSANEARQQQSSQVQAGQAGQPGHSA